MRNIKYFFIIGSMILLSLQCPGCNSSDQQGKAISELQNEIRSLKDEVLNLQSKIFALELGQNTYDAIALDPASPKGYKRIDTSSGIFLISLEEVKPYLDGYKVILDLGNTSSVIYSGFTLKAKWGRRYDYSVTQPDQLEYDKWIKSLQKKEVSFTNELKPASWNKVELILSPVKPEEFDYLEISMETDIVKLFENPK